MAKHFQDSSARLFRPLGRCQRCKELLEQFVGGGPQRACPVELIHPPNSQPIQASGPWVLANDRLDHRLAQGIDPPLLPGLKGCGAAVLRTYCQCKTQPVSRFLPLVLALLLLLAAPAAWATAGPDHYQCDGDALEAIFHKGPVDASDIPNRDGGTVPGSFIVLQWRGQSLQIPRSNQAGIPSYTDGRWWWQAVDPDHPTFKEFRGSIKTYVCSR